MVSYQNATRVFYNSKCPALEEQRKRMLSRVSPIELMSSVPIV